MPNRKRTSRTDRENRLRTERRIGDWTNAQGPVRVAVCYPNTYPVGMGNLGFLTVFKALAEDPHFTSERAFFPDDDRDAVSMESGAALSDFDILAFSVSYEGDYPNVARMLKRGGIPTLASQRNANVPLILAGGVAMAINPEPIADLIDAFVLGESEGALPALLDAIWEGRGALLDRRAILDRLKNVPHVYVPSGYVQRYDKGAFAGFKARTGFPQSVPLAKAPPGTPPVVSPMVTKEAAFGDMAVVETIRGCLHRCRFCAAGFVYLPPRPADRKAVVAAIESVAGASEVGLMGTAVSDRDDLRALIDLAAGTGAKVSLSSIRTGRLSADDYRALAQSGLKQVALAPEAGTERLRRVLNKDLTNKDLFKECDRLADAGYRRVKLYFMIGLPTETDDDVAAIAPLACKIRDRLKKCLSAKGARVSVDLSINPFVPKAHTPFQWHPMATEKKLKQAQDIVKDGISELAGVTASFESIRLSRMQAVFATGDRRLGAALDLMADGLPFKRALSASGLSAETFLEKSARADAPLPWDVVRTGVSKSLLADEYTEGLAGRITEPCTVGECRRCAACTVFFGAGGGNPNKL